MMLRGLPFLGQPGSLLLPPSAPSRNGVGAFGGLRPRDIAEILSSAPAQLLVRGKSDDGIGVIESNEECRNDFRVRESISISDRTSADDTGRMIERPEAMRGDAAAESEGYHRKREPCQPPQPQREDRSAQDDPHRAVGTVTRFDSMVLGSWHHARTGRCRHQAGARVSGYKPRIGSVFRWMPGTLSAPSPIGLGTTFPGNAANLTKVAKCGNRSSAIGSAKPIRSSDRSHIPHPSAEHDCVDSGGQPVDAGLSARLPDNQLPTFQRVTS